jgi:hypothetical protein
MYPEAKPEISHFNIVSSYVGLLCQGKNDFDHFDHIEAYRDDDFYAYAMGIDTVPSSLALRQRLDQAAPTSGWDKIIMEESADLLNKVLNKVKVFVNCFSQSCGFARKSRQGCHFFSFF